MIKELSRRVMQHGEDNCGPCYDVALFCADAEIVVEDEGKQIYLLGQWMPGFGNKIIFVATIESLYSAIETYNQFMDDDDENEDETIRRKLDHEIVRIYDEMTIQNQELFGNVNIHERYAVQYRELVGMLQQVVNDNGYDIDLLAADNEGEE